MSKLLPKKLYVNKKNAQQIGEFVLAYSSRKHKTDILYEIAQAHKKETVKTSIQDAVSANAEKENG